MLTFLFWSQERILYRNVSQAFIHDKTYLPLHSWGCCWNHTRYLGHLHCMCGACLEMIGHYKGYKVFIILIIIQANKATVTYCIACWTSKQRSRSATPLLESHWLWHSGMKTASCDSWSLRLSAKELFKAVQVHRQWLPGKTDARTALKDSSLEQSLGTEIEAHLWQSICDITHHGENLRREGRWKTQVAYSINPTYWKCSRTCTLEECSTVNSKHICDCFYF